MKAWKTLMVTVLIFAAFISPIWAGGGKDSKKDVTLSVMAGNVEADVIKERAVKYAVTHPGFAVDIVAIEGTTDFNTALAAKVAARDIPDIIVFGWGPPILPVYAQNGYILPLDDLGLDTKVTNLKKRINVINGKTYAYPIIQTLWGMFWNENLAKQYGVNYVPKTMDQLLQSFATMRANGLQYPYLTAGMDLSGATWMVMTYMHQQLVGLDPLFYYKICTGEKSWNGPEIRQLYEYYGKMLEYAPKDIMGVDQDEFRRRFARSEVVMSINGSNMISTIRALNPNLDFILAPAPAILDENNYCVISDFNTGVAIGATAKNPDVAKDFFKFLFEPESGGEFAQALVGFSPVKGAEVGSDPATTSNLPFLDSGNFVGFSERDWIPGIRDVLKKNTQDWMSGAVSLDASLNNLQAEHQRLLNATPSFINEYRDLLRSIGLIN
jgi:raffinose/stachyose/melibiose transport system substrate-binding protein